MQDNAKLHKTHTQSILLYKITHGHPHLQGEINANQLQACTGDELKQKTAPMQSTWIQPKGNITVLCVFMLLKHCVPNCQTQIDL